MTVNECHDEVCITCSDSAVPVRITELLADGMASVDTGSGIEQISVALVAARAGDLVLVHAKEAIAVLEPDQPLQPDQPPQPDQPLQPDQPPRP